MGEERVEEMRKDQEIQSEYLFKIGVRWAVSFAAAAFSSVFLFGAFFTINSEHG